MDRAMAISLIIHLLLVTPFFFIWKEKNGYQNISTIELLQIGPPNQRAQKKRVKGIKKKPPVKKLKKTPFASKPQKQQKIGNDIEDAPEIASGGTMDPSLLAVASYAQQLQQFIERNRYYPRRALVMEQTGTVKVRLTIEPNGRFSTIELVEGSDYNILNKAARELVTQLKAFKPLPADYKGDGTFEIPINYQIRAGKL